MGMVQNKVLFHISRETTWEIGQTIISGERENPFWRGCKEYSPKVVVNGETMPIFEMIRKFPNFDVTADNINFLYANLKNLSKEFAFYIRERTFEDVRREYYPELPSRQKCLWLSEEDQLPFWRTMEENTQRSLLVLELSGDIFCGDAFWLTADTFSSIEYTNRARHYWSGDLTDVPQKEYLFYGKALIKAILPFK